MPGAQRPWRAAARLSHLISDDDEQAGPPGARLELQGAFCSLGPRSLPNAGHQGCPLPAQPRLSPEARQPHHPPCPPRPSSPRAQLSRPRSNYRPRREQWGDSQRAPPLPGHQAELGSHPGVPGRSWGLSPRLWGEYAPQEKHRTRPQAEELKRRGDGRDSAAQPQVGLEDRTRPPPSGRPLLPPALRGPHAILVPVVPWPLGLSPLFLLHFVAWGQHATPTPWAGRSPAAAQGRHPDSPHTRLSHVQHARTAPQTPEPRPQSLRAGKGAGRPLALNLPPHPPPLTQPSPAPCHGLHCVPSRSLC